MTNKERQASLDKKKWLSSERWKINLSGGMSYCYYCKYKVMGAFDCKATQEEREGQCLCAKAYNRMERAK